MVDLSRFPRRRYTHGATPIEFLPNLTKAVGGPKIWIKRDDQLGLTPGGNKTRKLEFLVADALEKGCDTLITCGAPQSNHCRITLSAALKEGLKCRFVIEERVPGSYSEHNSGNNFLFQLMGVEEITVTPGGSDLAAEMQKIADSLAAEGRKGYVIPGGGSNALGGLGYVAGAQEIQQQLFEQSLPIDRVVLGSGSSGTHGGMVAGFLANHLNIALTGVGVSRDPADQAPLVLREAQAVCDLLELGVIGAIVYRKKESLGMAPRTTTNLEMKRTGAVHRSGERALKVQTTRRTRRRAGRAGGRRGGGRPTAPRRSR